MHWLRAFAIGLAWAAAAPALAQIVAAPGVVEPVSREIFVDAAATGIIAELLVEEGDVVGVGQVIARVADGQHRARVVAAEGLLAQAEAERDKVVAGPLPSERRQALAAVGEATAVAEQASRERDRQRDLLGRGWTTPQAVERAERDHAVALARVATAKQYHATVDRPPRPEDIAAAEAAVVAAQGQRALAGALLDDTLVRSPIAGTILRVLRHPGELVSELRDTPVVAMGDTSALRVRAEVDEADIAGLRPGQSAYVTAPAFGATRFAGKIVRIGNRMGRKSIRTDNPTERVDSQVLEVLIELDDCPPLPVGLRVDAFILGGESG